MVTDSSAAQLTLDNWSVAPEFFGQERPFPLNLHFICPGQVAAPAERLIPPSSDFGQIIRELTYLCQAASAAFERSQRLQAVIRPFLSNATWQEAAEVAGRGGQGLPTETRQMTILRLDIVNFTELMGQHPLDQVLTDLNAYLGRLTGVVYCHNGDVNKYLGDGFIAIFASADDAVQAACTIQQVVADFNRHQAAQGGLVFPSRIGIDSGEVALTSLGSVERQDRTVIGMPVNLADRLQALATPGRVWLSQATFESLSDQSDCRCLGPTPIKGRSEPITVYEKVAGSQNLSDYTARVSFRTDY